MGEGNSASPKTATWSGALYATGWGGNAGGSSGNMAHVAFAVNSSYFSDRYGDYTEVNPLYESTKFFIKY